MMKKISKSSMIFVFLLLSPLYASAVTTDVSGFPIAAIILSPMILGFFFMLGAFILDPEEHGVLRIFFVLFALLTYYLSAWFGILTIVQYYSFDPLQDAIGKSVFIVGAVMFTIIAYFLIYAFYKATHAAAQQKQEMMLQ